VRLLPIAVLQPILSPLLSVSCRLITPYVRLFCFKNDGPVVTLALRGVQPWWRSFFSLLTARSSSAFRHLRDCARARVADAGAPTCARVVRAAVVCLDAKLGDGCCADGALLCSDLADMVRRPAGNCWLLSAGCWRGVYTGSCKTDGKVKRDRDPSCTTDAHRRAHGAVQRCVPRRLSVTAAGRLCSRCANSQLGAPAVAQSCARPLRRKPHGSAGVVPTAVFGLDAGVYKPVVRASMLPQLRIGAGDSSAGCCASPRGCPQQRCSGVAGVAAMVSTAGAKLFFFTRGLLPNHGHGLVQDQWQGETRSRFKLRGRSACTAVRTVPCKDAHQKYTAVDAGGDENAMLVATEVHGIVAVHGCTGDGGFRNGSSTAGDAAG
jgi:hypothetical protein